MNSNRMEPGDEENSSFDLQESALENLKPGLVYAEQPPAPTTEKTHGAEVHHRFPRRDKKDIPEGSLASRIRKAAE